VCDARSYKSDVPILRWRRVRSRTSSPPACQRGVRRGYEDSGSARRVPVALLTADTLVMPIGIVQLVFVPLASTVGLE
jgi:hypothetical protein